MTIEAKLDALTKALEENTAALKANGGKSGGSSGGSGSSGKSGGSSSKSTTKKVTKDDLGNTAAGYLKAGPGDKDGRVANVRRIAEKFGQERITLVGEDNYAEAMDLLKQYVAGEDPLADESGEEEGDSVL